MLYIRIEDNQLHLASYAAATEQQREAALALGRILPEGPVLSITQSTLAHGANAQQTLADMRLEVPEFNENIEHSPVTVLVSGPATLVPTDDVPVDDDDFVFNSCFSFKNHEERSVHANEIPALRQRLLFGVQKTVEEAIAQEFRYPELRFTSTLTPLLEHYAEKHRGDRGVQIYVNCRERFIDVFAFAAGRLTVLNSFAVNTIADASYFVVALMKNMDYDMANVACRIIGDGAMAADLVQTLRRFIAHVDAVDAVKEFRTVSMLTVADVPFDIMAHINSL